MLIQVFCSARCLEVCFLQRTGETADCIQFVIGFHLMRFALPACQAEAEDLKDFNHGAGGQTFGSPGSDCTLQYCAGVGLVGEVWQMTHTHTHSLSLYIIVTFCHAISEALQ